ncbi:MAG: ZIP family metal transporter [Clostridia bacterium]|nr:ZIP family metal transporter [Clostridia bacterium]
MIPEVWRGALIPLLGTSLGAACAFAMKGRLNPAVQRGLTGFAAGVMTAASVWSLLLPAIEQAAPMGRWAFLPAAVGFWIGVLFLPSLDRLFLPPRGGPGAARGRMNRTAMLILAVTLHNLPEGMAVGAAFAGWLQGRAGLTAAGATALSLGIAIQNFPEGAIIALPLRAQGWKRWTAFACGALSGVIEPIGALAMIRLSRQAAPLMPYLLSFAAGAMIYVVTAELTPAAAAEQPEAGAALFSLGFSVMMALDVAMG